MISFSTNSGVVSVFTVLDRIESNPNKIYAEKGLLMWQFNLIQKHCWTDMTNTRSVMHVSKYRYATWLKEGVSWTYFQNKHFLEKGKKLESVDEREAAFRGQLRRRAVQTSTSDSRLPTSRVHSEFTPHTLPFPLPVSYDFFYIY